METRDKTMGVRLADPADGPELLAIYGRYIDTPITFEYALPGREEFARRIADTLEHYPYLVVERDGRPMGYAYAHRLGERAAYQWNAELSIYLHPDLRGAGAGRRLYRVLMELLRRQGVKTAYGVVTTPNSASEGLHRAMGFRLLGVHRNTGYKDGRWHDVAWFEKALAPYDADPAPVLPLGDLSREQVAGILAGF